MEPMLDTRASDTSSGMLTKHFEALIGWARDADESETRRQRLWAVPHLAMLRTFGGSVDPDSAEHHLLAAQLREEVAQLVTTETGTPVWHTALEARIRNSRELASLRPWQQSDAECYRRLLDNPSLWQHLPESYPAPLTQEQAGDLIQMSNTLPDRHIVRAIRTKDAVVGQVRLQFDSSKDPASAEISYWLGEAYWGAGITSQTVARFTAWCFERYPTLRRIFANVMQGNDASNHVLLNAGYHRERFRCLDAQKNGRAYSTTVFGVHRLEYEALNKSALKLDALVNQR